MKLLSYPGIKLPTVYITNDTAEVVMLRDAGLPYIRTSDDNDRVVMYVLYHWLSKRFPHIKWFEMLGIRQLPDRYVVYVPGRKATMEEAKKTHYKVESADLSTDMRDEEYPEGTETRDLTQEVFCHDVAEEDREFFDTEGDDVVVDKIVGLMDFCADELNRVNVEQLQALGMLPAFMSDVADAIRTNLLTSMQWRDGWNKRLSCAMGDFSVGTKASNLIILDISGSIPTGISATMLELIDSLRSQAEADLIITGGSSYYWPASAELPSPEWIRANINTANEAVMFYQILRERLAGRHFGNVISFGDNDCPVEFARYEGIADQDDSCAYGITVDRVMHYHTWQERATGYAKWVHQANPDVEAVYDTSWCNCMAQRRW